MASSLESQAFAIKNVRVFDGKQLSEPKTVYVSAGLIVNAAEDAQTIDGDGGVLIPGLIDAHIHLNTAHELQTMARHGVTTGLDMATWPRSKIEAQRGAKGASDFRTPGAPATSPGSMHTAMLPLPPTSLVLNPEDAVRFVEERVAEGVDYIKMIADDPGPDQETLNTIVSEAHKHGKLVVAHAAAIHAFSMAQDAAADVITHVPCDGTLDDAASQRMARENQVAVPHPHDDESNHRTVELERDPHTATPPLNRDRCHQGYEEKAPCCRQFKLRECSRFSDCPAPCRSPHSGGHGCPLRTHVTGVGQARRGVARRA